MPIYRNALAQRPANMLAYEDTLSATPRNPYLGALADLVAQGYAPQRTQQMQGVARFLSAPAISQTLDRLSYGEPLTTGAGMTTRIRPEAIEAGMAVAPLAQPATMATLQAARAARQAAMSAGKAGERYAERVLPGIMERGGLPAQLVMDLTQGTRRPLDVFHGTPHKFPPTERNPLGEFDASKIGTGEGAQVYGYGLYTAEAPEVAQGYQKTLAHKNFAAIVQNGRNDYSVIAKDGSKVADRVMLGQAHKAKDAFDAAQTGSLYKVDLPDEQIGKMLDFDTPLSKQSPEVQAKLKAVVDQQLGKGTWNQWIKSNPDYKNLANDLFEGKPSAEISQLLRESGIPGIKYFDQNSRAVPNITNSRLAALYEKNNQNAEAAVDEFMRSVYNTPKKKAEMRQQFLEQLATPKTRNFVVFPGEEKSMTILERNGQSVNALQKNKR